MSRPPHRSTDDGANVGLPSQRVVSWVWEPGQPRIAEIDGIAPEYPAAAHRYLGDEAATEMLVALDQPGTAQALISVQPTWVGLLDFVTRLPAAQGGVQR